MTIIDEQRRAGAPAPTLSLRDIRKQFGPVKALQGISLEFHGGEVVGLLGENGAGKSTLLRTLSGDYQPDSGQLFIDGEEIVFRSPREAHEHGIHVVYQEPELVPELTVAENLSLGSLPSRAHLVSPRETLEVARRLIEEQGFGGTLDPDQLVSSCSPAQRQCIEILKAVRDNVRLLCLDEPTSSLSEDESQRLWALMERLRSTGTAIIYVSHRMAEIIRLCQRVAIMRDGELVAESEAGELTEADMIRMMVGRPLSRMFPSRETEAGAVIVEMHGVTTSHVSDIDLHVRAGEIVGLAGLVGAGRTEVAQALYGMDPILAGSIAVEGRTMRLSTPAQAIKAGIGLSPEDRKGQGLFLERSVSDNISLTRLRSLSRFHVVRRAAESELVAGMIKRMRVKTRTPESLARTLSGGNQQKVLLSRWVAVKPKLLILDEPTRGIDVGAKAEIYHLIDELTRDGMAVLIISSEMPELIGLADRILVMREGRIVGQLAGDEATEEDILRLALGSDEEQS
ncbi:sugar ABC transporter ATP-binding protein [Compostimonas suwonensis]|uniref:L-arabinose transport system ATP-binding protein n=1 Tax=Compostimonas suwonensis TaxID=1048394 RepID=A0A2M9C3Q1_9MICO|nr:sugar ABC transporter ATP-binding protein [Compostimonas suwonensis]PJJ65154.1 L-arabinose transport system ATP-binding protein [Compostimonas suwonensis]